MANSMIKSRKWKMVARSLMFSTAVLFLGLVSIQCQVAHTPLTPPPSEQQTDIRCEGTNYETVIQPAETQQESLPKEEVKQNEPKKNNSRLGKNRDRAIEWLDEKATRAPRHQVVQYVDFVSENVEPRFQLLVLTILTIESEGDPKAKSPDGSLGLTQILPRCWEKELKAQGIIKDRKDFFDYRKNILSCQYILQKNEGERRSLNRTLIRYNHSKKYVKKVIARMENLKKALQLN